MRSPLIAVSLALCAVLIACSGGGSGERPSPTAASTATTPKSTVASGATPGGSTATPLAPVGVERVFAALGFPNMTGMYQMPDGSRRFLVLEQQGRIRVFDDRVDVSQAAVFLDIRDRVNSSGTEQGLLGLAFAPDFAKSGTFYLDYTASNPSRTVIARFKASGDRSSANPASEERLLEIGQPFSNHNGGQLAFGLDGYLYIGMGDGGSANDPGNRAQNLNELLGKILRIDVSGSGNGLAYRIPPDNPFAGQSGRRGEIFAYGLRNPWRFSFDGATGALWAGDVGQNSWEEVDIITKGANYGWPQMEGSHCNGARSQSCDPSGTVLPVTEYATASPNCAILGGFVYRGSEIASLQGAYVYGDYCSGRVWALRYDGKRVTEQAQIADTGQNLTSFAVDADGNLYLLARGQAGGIYELRAR